MGYAFDTNDLLEAFANLPTNPEDEADAIIDGEYALLGSEQFKALIAEIRRLRAENAGLRARPIYVPMSPPLPTPTLPPPYTPIWYGDGTAAPPPLRHETWTGLDTNNGAVGLD